MALVNGVFNFELNEVQSELYDAVKDMFSEDVLHNLYLAGAHDSGVADIYRFAIRHEAYTRGLRKLLTEGDISEIVGKIMLDKRSINEKDLYL